MGLQSTREGGKARLGQRKVYACISMAEPDKQDLRLQCRTMRLAMMRLASPVFGCMKRGVSGGADNRAPAIHVIAMTGCSRRAALRQSEGSGKGRSFLPT